MIDSGISARHPLVVADASDASSAALRAGVEFAQESCGRLSVVYLLAPQPRWWMGSAPLGCSMPAPLELSNFEVAETWLAIARTEVPADVPLNTQLLTGRRSPCKQVLGAARAFGCDAIVVAAPRCLVGLRLGFGSTLALRSEVPVALIDTGSGHPQARTAPARATSLFARTEPEG